VGRIAGIALAAAFVALGFALLEPVLRGLAWRARASYAGVAMLVGASVSGIALCVLAVADVRVTLWAFLVVALVLGGAGIAAARLLPERGLAAAAPPEAPVLRPTSKLGDIAETVGVYGVVALGVVALVGAFRATPWLDDTWFFWLPKGLLLSSHGLDPRLFSNDTHFDFFARNDNPLWWSVILVLVVKLSGNLDLHAVNVLQVCLFLGFVGAVARLLATRVRSELLWPGLLLLVLAPELLRQLDSGAADLTMAAFMALAALTGALWLARGEVFALVLFVPFAAGAMQGKGEGIPELLLFVALVSVALGRSWRRLAWLWAGVGAGLVAWLPWYWWRHAHDVANVFSVKDSLNPGYLADHTDRLHLGWNVLRTHYTAPHEWSVIVPAVLVLSVVAFWLWRRPLALFPAAFVVVTFVFWLWLIWADPQADFRAGASSYRYVDPPLIAAALCVPVLLEAIARGRRRRRDVQ
jgi:hypothetical protein